MRVVLVGQPGARVRLRRQLAGTSIDIVGEAATMDEARDHGLAADGFVVAIDRALASDEPIAEPLSPREREVLELVAEGLPNKAIAARLGISDQTVKFHVASISGKLGAANRTEAVRLAIRRGLITI